VDIGPEPEIFITILYGELNTLNHCFKYVNAAHSPPLIFRNESKKLEELAQGDKSLGRLGNIELEEHEIKLDNGDLLLFYTNGVIQALEGPQHNGKEVLREIIRSNHELSPSLLVEKIKNKFSQSETNPDDLVVAVLKVD
jgi:sigma-B regulation protein RsbU (phosphoserine phosphatase)